MQSSALIKLREEIGKMQRGLIHQGDKRSLAVLPAPPDEGIVAIRIAIPVSVNGKTRTLASNPTIIREDAAAVQDTLAIIERIQAERARRRGGSSSGQ